MGGVVRLVTPVTVCSTRTYSRRDLALTRHIAKLSISPESSDGFASVGTILPKEEATSLPGGLFAFLDGFFEVIFREEWLPKWEEELE